jgi:hypothetical protein
MKLVKGTDKLVFKTIYFTKLEELIYLYLTNVLYILL